MFYNGINALSKIANRFFFLSKSSKFGVVWTIRFCTYWADPDKTRPPPIEVFHLSQKKKKKKKKNENPKQDCKVERNSKSDFCKLSLEILTFYTKGSDKICNFMILYVRSLESVFFSLESLLVWNL